METEEKKPETEATQPEIKDTPATSPEETPDQINWRKFREVREKERKEKIAAEKRAEEKEAEVAALKAAMEAIVNKPSNNTQIEEYAEETDDQRIKRLISETIDQQRKHDQIEREKKELQEFPQKLASDFQDFNQVCTEENLDYLEFHYPEVAAAFKELPDGYNKWAKVYKAVKRFIPNIESKKEQNKAEKNFMKPQAMSVGGRTPTGDTAPQNLDDKRKADNWQRMQKVMRGG